MNAETKIVNAIRESLGGVDSPVLVWRLNQGSFRPPGSRHMYFYGLRPGASDVLGLVRGSGRFLAIEVKTATGTEQENQETFRALVNRTGGYACVARTVPEALAHARAAAAGDRAPE